MIRYLPLLLIVGLLLTFRVVGTLFPENLPNFQPLSAVFFCGAILATGWRGFAIPLAVWAISYPLGIGPVSDPAIFFSTLLAFGLVFALGKWISTLGHLHMILGSIAAAVLFHLVTNSLAWLGDPLYAKNLTGLWQSLWTGPVGSPIPSWIFLRNMAIANLLFTSIFVLAQLRMPRLTTHAAPAIAK